MFWDFEAIFMASVLGVIFQVISPFSYFFSCATFSFTTLDKIT
jgi:hypothetical protein